MSLLSLLLLLSMGPPQAYALQPSSQTELTERFMASQAQHSRRLDHIQIDRIRSSDNLCFAMRTYIFKREDGNAPQLVGTTTCTPARVFRSEKVGPRSMLVPLNLK